MEGLSTVQQRRAVTFVRAEGPGSALLASSKASPWIMLWFSDLVLADIIFKCFTYATHSLYLCVPQRG